MNILFDQGTPSPLRKYLLQHDVATAYERGWSLLKNGELLREAETSGFEIPITTDQNLKYQQNLLDRRIAIVVLLSTSWPRIQQHIEHVQQVIDSIAPGAYVEIPIP